MFTAAIGSLDVMYPERSQEKIGGLDFGEFCVELGHRFLTFKLLQQQFI